jgi:hypothetical protein
MQLLPGIYIILAQNFQYLYGDVVGNYATHALNFFFSCALFIVSIFIGRYFVPIYNYKFKFTRRFIVSDANKKVHFYSSIIGIIACGLIAIYFLAGGYEKLILLGSDADSWGFRLVGYDDRSRYLTVMLEVSRKFLLPLSLLYVLIFKHFYSYKSGKLAFAFAFFQLLAASMTLDRAPFFILLVVIIFPYMLSRRGLIGFVKLLLIAFIFIVLLGGLITNLQYNIIDFSLSEIVNMGLDFVLHRFLLVPSITPIELSFAIFPPESEKLWLKYSRLNQLIGGELVGTSDDASLFVAPVGAVGDIWRNFGFFGLLVWGLILGLISKIFDIGLKHAPFPIVLVQYFLVVSLSFYYVMGVFFSQGAVLALILCCCHVFLMKNILRLKY